MAEQQSPTVGEQIKAAQNGSGPRFLTVDQIMERAPKDLREEVVHVPEWDGDVRIKSYTAAELSRIRDESVTGVGETAQISLGKMEILQFQLAVVEPRFSEEQVRNLRLVSGRGFSRVIEAIDNMTGTDKEELRRAQQEFPGADE